MRFLPRTLPWILSISFLGFFIFLLIRTNAWALLGRLGIFLATILVFISVLYFLEIVLATKVLLHGMGYGVPYVDLYLVLTACLPANSLTPGKVGIPIRLFLFKKLFEIPFPVSTANLALELVIGSAVLGATSLVTLPLLFEDILMNKWLLMLLSGVVVGGVAFFALMRTRPDSFILLGQHFLTRYLERAMDFVTRFRNSVRQTSQRELFVFTLLLLIRIGIKALVTYVILLRFGYPLSPVVVVCIQSVSGLLAILSMLPVGLGVQELSSVVLLTHMGVPESIAALVAMIERALWTLVPVGLGVISMNRLGIRWLGSLEQSEDAPTRSSQGQA